MRSDPAALSGLDEITWERIVHFHGRATDIPAAIRNLASPHTETRRAAVSHLTHCLEHQDGVYQATAYAVPYIIQMLRSANVREKSAIISMLQRFLNSARFTLEHHTRLPSDALSRYRSPAAHLWPVFRSELDDEMQWEEWEPSVDEYTAWHQLTERAIVDARSLIGELCQSDDPELADRSGKLLTLIDSNTWAPPAH